MGGTIPSISSPLVRLIGPVGDVVLDHVAALVNRL